MTEHNPPLPPAGPVEGTSNPGANRRFLMLALGGVLILVVGYLALKALSGGGSSSPTASPTTLPSGKPAPSVTTTTTAPGGVPAPVQSFEIFSDKNPFQPLSFAPTGGGSTAGGTTSGGTASGATSGGGTSTGATGTGTTPGGATSGGSTATTVAGTGSGGAQEPQAGQRVLLQDVFASGGRTVANVKVNSTVYTVGVGDAFATNYKVVSLSQSTKCGTFLFGDNQFRLCQGEEVIK